MSVLTVLWSPLSRKRNLLQQRAETLKLWNRKLWSFLCPTSLVFWLFCLRAAHQYHSLLGSFPEMLPVGALTFQVHLCSSSELFPSLWLCSHGKTLATFWLLPCLWFWHASREIYKWSCGSSGGAGEIFYHVAAPLPLHWLEDGLGAYSAAHLEPGWQQHGVDHLLPLILHCPTPW